MLINNVHIIGSGKNPSRIFIDGFKISATDNNVNEEADLAGYITFKFNDAIAFPGLINSHDHLEFNLFPQLGNKVYKDYVEWGSDIHKKNAKQINAVKKNPYELRFKWGLYKNLICGVTTVAHHGKGPVYNYERLPGIISNYNYLHSIRLERYWQIKMNKSFNKKPLVIHIGEGMNAESVDEINQMLKWNLFGKQIVGVHGIALNKRQSEKLKALVWCPDSNLFLYNKTADIARLKNHTDILFGTDSTLSADWNLWNHLRLARNVNVLSDNELFDSLTAKAANIWNNSSVGSISAGKTADIVISKRKHEEEWESFYSTNPEDILLVLKQGKIVLIEKSFGDNLRSFNPDEYDLITVGSSIKYVTKGIKEIIALIGQYLQDVELPFKIS